MATLAALAASQGFDALGVRVSARALFQLKVPAIAYLRYQGVPHFSVIRGVSKGGRVHLADPSWGNRHLTMDQFLALWAVDPRPTTSAHGRGTTAHAAGRLLLIKPVTDGHYRLDRRFFRPELSPPLMLPTSAELF